MVIMENPLVTLASGNVVSRHFLFDRSFWKSKLVETTSKTDRAPIFIMIGPNEPPAGQTNLQNPENHVIIIVRTISHYFHWILR